MMVMEIDTEAFTMMVLMEMDSLLQIPPSDAFRRLGFSGVSSRAAALCLFWEIQGHGVNILEEAVPTSHGMVAGMVGRHHTSGRYDGHLLLVR